MSDEIKSYTIPVSNIDDIWPNPNIIALKNEHGEMRKRNTPCVIHFHKDSKLKTWRALLVFIRIVYALEEWEWVKADNKSCEDRYKEVEDYILCNITKYETYLDIDYEEPENFSFVHSDDEEDNTEFSMIDPDLLDLDL